MLNNEIANFMVGVVIVIFSVIILSILVPLFFIITGIVLLIRSAEYKKRGNLDKAKKLKESGIAFLIAGIVFLASSIFRLIQIYGVSWADVII